MMTSCASGRCTIPLTTRLVVCGRLLVMATLAPTSAFIRVDLPVLGRPTKQANPDLNLAAAGVCGALTFVIVPCFGS